MLVSEKDLAVKDKGARITDGNISKLGDTYQIGEASLDDIVINGKIDEADQFSNQWFITDKNGKVYGLSKEGIAAINHTTNLLMKFGDKKYSDQIGNKLAGSLALFGSGLSVWNTKTHDQKIELLRNAFFEKVQDIIKDDTKYRTAQEKGRALAAYSHSIYEVFHQAYLDATKVNNPHVQPKLSPKAKRIMEGIKEGEKKRGWNPQGNWSSK